MQKQLKPMQTMLFTIPGKGDGGKATQGGQGEKAGPGRKNFHKLPMFEEGGIASLDGWGVCVGRARAKRPAA